MRQTKPIEIKIVLFILPVATRPLNTIKSPAYRLKLPVFNRLPIRQRLPFFIFILLVVIVIAFGWISYTTVKNTSIDERAGRITSLADKLTLMFKQSMDRFAATGKTMADQRAIVAYLSSGKTADSARTLRLFREEEKKDTSTKLIQLLNSQRQEILRNASNNIYLRPDIDKLNGPGGRTAKYISVGKIVTLKKAMYFPILAPVKSKNKTIGYVVLWDKLHATPQSIQQIAELLGSNGRIYFGNDDGKFWTNLIQPVVQPAVELSTLRPFAEYRKSSGEPVMGAVRPIPNSKWLVWVELSSTALFRTIDHYLHWMLIIGAILALIGSFGGWMMTRNITIPLKQLKTAAADIARGDYTLHLESTGKDELAELAASFNIMAMNVRMAQESLEEKVQVRTLELRNAEKNVRNEKENVKRKDEFISIASHELKTPLTTIKAFFQIVGKELQPESKSLGLVKGASRQVRRMESLINDLLDVSRINTGKMEYRMEVIDFFPLLKNVTDSVQAISPGHRLIIQQSISARITADHNRIEQAFINILNNAVKFSPDADRVLISCELVANRLYVRIKDFGVGISGSEMDKLFDKFAQAERDFRFQGLGLGLFISSEIIKRHNGSISVMSQPGKGTEFTVQLPVE